MKVLFLDIDGVLNSSRTAVAFRGYPHDLTTDHVAMLDPVGLNLIRGLCAIGGVSVVVSSAWRTTHHWDAIGRALDLPTMDRTPSLLGCRGDEIADWLKRHPDVECWAIIDDDADMLPDQLPRFVHVDGHDGIRWADFVQLCSLFGVDAYGCSPQRIRVGSTMRLMWEDAPA